MKNFFLYIFILSNILIGHSRLEAKEQELLIFVDLSSSISPEEFQNVKLYINNYFEVLSEEGRKQGIHQVDVTILPVHSLTYSASPIARKTILLKKGIKYKNTRKKSVENLLKEIESRTVVPKNRRYAQSETDLLSTIDRANFIFSKRPDLNKHIIYISDIIQETHDFSFIRNNKLIGELDTETLLKKQKWSIGCLKDVEISIIKPSGVFGRSNPLPPAFLKQVDRFWIKMFVELGAKVTGIEVI